MIHDAWLVYDFTDCFSDSLFFITLCCIDSLYLLITFVYVIRINSALP
jgi:hypothetical protein